MSAAYRFALKCMKCGLHFNIYTWRDDWQAAHKQPFCPECGSRQAFVLGSQPLSQEIFEYVPGELGVTKW